MNEISRGMEAELLLKNELFREAFDKTRQSIIDAMANSAFGDEKTHNHLVISLQLLNRVERCIKTVVETGKLAEIQYEREENMLKRGLRKIVG
jgi:hypothetical protein